VNRRLPSAAAALAVAGILLGSGVAGFLLSHLLAPPRPHLHAMPARTQTPSPPTAQTPTPSRRAVPERLPDVSLPDLDGVSHSLQDFTGRPLIINFWATWCEPCRREIPLLKSIRRENSRNDIEIVGIALDHLESVRQFVQTLGIDYPVLVGEKGGLEAVTAFGMDTVLPFSVFADSEGRIVTVKVGELHRDEASFILARLADLRRGRISLPDARERIGEQARRLAAERAATPTPQPH
jgi:thiol-disulfide isomerase/thioredoxin